MSSETEHLFFVGALVRHVLMGWPGVIVMDLMGNPFCSARWKVKFNKNGSLIELNMHEAELETRSEKEQCESA